ncbi:minor capsid protein [Phytohabitans aurantiacus]|uniref:Uncharacterized protein n=1 Tax=Phytohabitans aurantiacus TaxID=3016789 RepID=A0ABQ5QRV3_9ACTN|nr:minor capsid protein [Phytohabitans aurantiacus]GLH97345.1 hypothetical protein Pa4123_26200 [Phytohabitans aurantiacus]
MAGEGWTSLLLVGIAQRLHTAGIGTWRATGAYMVNETAIVIRAIPQTPNLLITLAPYPVGTALRGMQDHTSAIQIRVRGTEDPRVCDDLADAIFDDLDSLGRATLNTVAVVDMWRQSYTSLGQDAQNRWERSENYYVEAMRATTNRTD